MTKFVACPARYAQSQALAVDRRAFHFLLSFSASHKRFHRNTFHGPMQLSLAARANFSRAWIPCLKIWQSTNRPSFRTALTVSSPKPFPSTTRYLLLQEKWIQSRARTRNYLIYHLTEEAAWKAFSFITRNLPLHRRLLHVERLELFIDITQQSRLHQHASDDAKQPDESDRSADWKVEMRKAC